MRSQKITEEIHVQSLHSFLTITSENTGDDIPKPLFCMNLYHTLATDLWKSFRSPGPYLELKVISLADETVIKFCREIQKYACDHRSERHTFVSGESSDYRPFPTEHNSRWWVEEEVHYHLMLEFDLYSSSVLSMWPATCCLGFSWGFACLQLLWRTIPIIDSVFDSR